MAHPTAVAAAIEVHLAQLGSRNAHHEFERLAFHLARSTVGLNILPATGPVSAGGDDGRDFETHRTYILPPRGSRVAAKAIAFGCSLEKRIESKIRADVRKMVTKGTRVEEVHYFCAIALPVAKRHKLQEWAREQCRVHLEIYDAPAIANQLTLPNASWMAVRFLDVPPEIYPSVNHADAPALRTPSGLFHVPLDMNPYFSGRQNVLSLLDASAGRQVLAGMGGIGKTQTMLQHAYTKAARYSAVYWINGASRYSIVSDLKTILGGAEIDVSNQTDAEIISTATAYLESFDGWLLLVDNADDVSETGTAIPNTNRGHVIITTRLRNTSRFGIASVIAIEELSPEEALAFFEKRTMRILSGVERKESTELARELGGLPLALEQAAAYIHETGGSFSAYRASYARRRLDLLEKRHPDSDSYPASVATTWDLNFEQVRARSKAAADVMAIASLLAPDDIPVELFIGGWRHLGRNIARPLAGSGTDPFAFDEVLGDAVRFSLLRRDHQRRTVSIHRVVQDVVRSRLTASQRTRRMQQIANATGAVFPAQPVPEDDAAGRFVSHIEHLMAAGSHLPAHALMFVGNVVRLQDRYTDAETYYEAALSESGIDERNHARALVGKANVIKTRQRYGEATRCFVEAESIFRRTGGRIDVAVCLWGRANIEFATSHWDEALALYREASRIYADEPLSDGARLGWIDALKGETDVLIKQRRYDEAGECMEHAEGHYLRLERPIRLTYAKLQQGLGDVRRLLYVNAIRMGNPPNGSLATSSRTSYDLAIDTYRALATPLGEALSLYKRGELSVFEFGPDAALLDFDAAARVFDVCHDNTLGSSKAKLALAKIELLRGSASDDLLRRLLALLATFREDCKSVYWTAESSITTAACAHALGRRNEEETLLTEAERLFTTLRRDDKLDSIARLRTTIYTIVDAFWE